MRDETARWVLIAEEDYANLQVQENTNSLLCYLALQCVEKYLKAFLIEHTLPFPRTHDLERLLELCISTRPQWEVWRGEIAEILSFETDLRYPGALTTDTVVQQCLDTATRFREAARAAIGVPV